MHQALKDLSLAQKEESRVAKKEHSATTELEKALQAQEKARIVLTKAEADLKAAAIRVEKARKEVDDMGAAHHRAIGETHSAKDKLDQVQATFSEKKEERNERLAALGSRNISPTSSNNSSTVGVNRSASQRYASGSSLGPGGAAIGRSTSASSLGWQRTPRRGPRVHWRDGHFARPGQPCVAHRWWSRRRCRCRRRCWSRRSRWR